MYGARLSDEVWMVSEALISIGTSADVLSALQILSSDTRANPDMEFFSMDIIFIVIVLINITH